MVSYITTEVSKGSWKMIGIYGLAVSSLLIGTGLINVTIQTVMGINVFMEYYLLLVLCGLFSFPIFGIINQTEKYDTVQASQSFSSVVGNEK